MKKKMLVLAHRDELLEQAREKLLHVARTNRKRLSAREVDKLAKLCHRKA